jgi:homoserine kinase type II
MSVITKLTKLELESFLSDFNLAPLSDYKEIPEGTVNTNYFLETGEQRYVLSLFEHLNLDMAEQYLKLTHFLYAKKLPCAMPIPNKNHELVQSLKNKPTAIVTRLSGGDITHPNAHQCYAVGEFLAKMHLYTQDYVPHIKNPMDSAWRSHHAHKLMPTTSNPEQNLLQQGLLIQTQIPWGKLPKAMLHYDLFRDNALFTQNKLTGVFDFYYSCFDAMLLDIAICLNDWCTDWVAPGLNLDNNLTEHLIAGYQSHRRLNKIEHAQLLPMVQLMAFHFWVARSTSLLQPRNGSKVTTKPPEEFKIIFENRLNMNNIQI